MKQDHNNIFCDCPGSGHDQDRFCSDPEMVVQGLNDAYQEFNASNWHQDKFNRAIEVIKAYCKEHKIPYRFVKGNT